MINGLKYTLLVLAVSLVGIFAMSTNNISAQTKDDIQCGANVASERNCSVAAPTTPESTVNSILKKVLTIFSVIIGVAAVIMIMLGGFKYITSNGDSAKVGSAKTTIIYALIGLVIVALAQVIVNLVLNKVTS
jgi:hypothetical protein